MYLLIEIRHNILKGCDTFYIRPWAKRVLSYNPYQGYINKADFYMKGSDARLILQ